MHEVRPGGANLGDDPGDIAPVLLQVAQRVAHGDAVLPHVGPEAVLDVGLAAPHHQEHVERIVRGPGAGRGLGDRRAGQRDEDGCREPAGCDEPSHAASRAGAPARLNTT